jgi:hypothetical protein
MTADRGSFLAGLFFTTAGTLLLEILDTRLLSVLTWYHLSFFAVSTAMFGMAAGAVRVYLGGSEFEGENAPRALARHATRLAVAIPVTHVANLVIPIRTSLDLVSVLALALSITILAIPFYLSGIVVAIALTRIPGRSGRIYACDLLGAALGCVVVVPLLNASSVSAGVLTSGATAATGAVFFHRFAETRRAARITALAVGLLTAAWANDGGSVGLEILYPKGAPRTFAAEDEHWTIHGQVTVSPPRDAAPRYWAAGRGGRHHRVNRRTMLVDGGAGTWMTAWDGEPEGLAWVQYDVTSLPYHLRRGGSAAVIGVGGGRDILTALWAESSSVVGIEVNEAFLHLLRDRLRGYAKLADHPGVELHHDDGRAWLTRTDRRFDVIQMSLVDTWAATGAGAFTLSENGLYTAEAWKVFLAALQPGGILSVSRWYSRDLASETSRLVALATWTLLDAGASDPSSHLALVAIHNVATLLVSNQPFSRADRDALAEVAARLGFDVLLAPDQGPSDATLGRIAASRSPEALRAATAHEDFDYSVPTDQRPYFFNILRPGRVVDYLFARQSILGVVAQGNLLATWTLSLLWLIALIGVTAVIFFPLLRSGLPHAPRLSFAAGVLYFALIGLGFMLVQIPLIQRFSTYLGHPTYAISVILFAMILAAGIGSFLSDRLPVESTPRWLAGISLGVALLILAVTQAIQPLIDQTIQHSLLERCGIVVALVVSVSLPMGAFFPMGLRLTRRDSEGTLPWMWGVNGACSVLASVSAVGISMWSGIHTNLHLAAGMYAALTLPIYLLWKVRP